MGFHICCYCKGDDGFFRYTSNGDVTMLFDSGRSWVMPDMVVHYIVDHEWQPPVEFVEDVMSLGLVAGSRTGTKSPMAPTRVGYLSGIFETGQISWELVGKLIALLEKAARFR